MWPGLHIKVRSQDRKSYLWEIDAPPPEALWIWKMLRDAMGRPRPESVARGRGKNFLKLFFLHFLTDHDV